MKKRNDQEEWKEGPAFRKQDPSWRNNWSQDLDQDSYRVPGGPEKDQTNAEKKLATSWELGGGVQDCRE